MGVGIHSRPGAWRRTGGLEAPVESLLMMMMKMMAFVLRGREIRAGRREPLFLSLTLPPVCVWLAAAPPIRRRSLAWLHLLRPDGWRTQGPTVQQLGRELLLALPVLPVFLPLGGGSGFNPPPFFSPPCLFVSRLHSLRLPGASLDSLSTLSAGFLGDGRDEGGREGRGRMGKKKKKAVKTRQRETDGL